MYMCEEFSFISQYLPLYYNALKKERERERENGGGVGGHGVSLSPLIHQEYTFRQRCAWRTPFESGQEYRTSRKDYINHTKLGRMKELGGKTGVLVGLDLPPVDEGTEVGIRSSGQLSESEEKHLRLRVRQLICGSLNGMRIIQSLPQPYTPQTWTQVRWKTQQLRAGV